MSEGEMPESESTAQMLRPTHPDVTRLSPQTIPAVVEPNDFGDNLDTSGCVGFSICAVACSTVASEIPATRAKTAAIDAIFMNLFIKLLLISAILKCN